jgi:hypothetical protein
MNTDGHEWGKVGEAEDEWGPILKIQDRGKTGKLALQFLLRYPLSKDELWK